MGAQRHCFTKTHEDKGKLTRPVPSAAKAAAGARAGTRAAGTAAFGISIFICYRGKRTERTSLQVSSWVHSTTMAEYLGNEIKHTNGYTV